MYTKLPVQRLRILADNIKTAAFRRTLWSESTRDHMASWLHRVGNLADVGETVARQGQEMKDGSIASIYLGLGVAASAPEWLAPANFRFCRTGVVSTVLRMPH